ncbi:ABC transporter ATP-binding protein [Pontibacillus marinus]|uniref:Spermidine/putrescine ABC transporter ATP-binding protein n=1 Tax=Pontibacillus marinus BH030004 = DSM 16465 TaxID=1385511 RepID=A0A0A5FS12_9BACI|nr:ABC transporter ATP-binding protein [Pontibacillus marinus]KGX83531.1 spermidine/putrescine ABC transporter ATP-binding protein [Pontibacillus marinus BH030004 = DSM 16465]
MAFLDLNNLSHQYFTKSGFTKAIEDISLSVEEGSFVSFLGPSGCGKTTLLSIVAGLLQPTEGQVLIDQKPLKEQKASIGYMLQQDYLFPWKTIEQNVVLGPYIQGDRSEAVKQKAASILSEIGLGNVLQSYPSQLSGGMRQRVALARTLMTDPKILLLDEPFSALDYQTKLKLEDLVSNTLKSYNKTSLLVTHDIGEAIAMSDSIYLLSANPGRLSKKFGVPSHLKTLSPFDARQHNDFNALFQDIWKELNKLE